MLLSAQAAESRPGHQGLSHLWAKAPEEKKTEVTAGCVLFLAAEALKAAV